VIVLTWMMIQDTGLALQLDTRQPNLVNLNEDPQLAEVLMYILNEGLTNVGRTWDASSHGIKLDGMLISDDHW